MNEHREPSRWRRPQRWLPLTIFLCLVAGVVLYAIVGHYGIKQDLAAIRKRGMPVSALELDTWYKRVPASDNAALVILEATRERMLPTKGKDPEESKERIGPGEPLPPRLAEIVAGYVKRNAVALEKIEEAAEMPGSRYPIDLSRGPETLLPHLAPIKGTTQLVKWTAIQQSADGNPNEAVRTLRNGFAMAATLEAEPLLISELVRIACVSILMDAVERVVSDHALTEEQIAALSAAIQKAEQHGRSGLARALAGERGLAIPLFHLSYREYAKLEGLGGGSQDEGLGMLKAGLFVSRQVLGLQDRDLGFYIQTIEGLERATQLEYPEMLRATEEIGGKVEREFAQHPWKYTISRMLQPSLAPAAKKEAILAARLRCAAVALAIERYRVRHEGKLPRLDELMPESLKEMPKDPVDGRPLEYQINEGKGYKISAPTSTAVASEGKRPTNRQDVAFTVVR
jgi:hypothetical protein